MGDEIIRFDNVIARYHDSGDAPRDVLKNATFSLKHGGFYFLTGPSGSGKSTLLKLLYMGLKPSKGLLRLFGRDVNSFTRIEQARIRRRIGVVFQDYRLISHLNAFENVALPLKLNGRLGKDKEEDILELLHWVGLKGREDALPPSLSGGEQQRIAIARAVVNKPALLLADEPTGNVDDLMAKRLIRLFEQLNKLGTTVLIATHSKQIIQEFPHSVLKLEEGQVRHAD